MVVPAVVPWRRGGCGEVKRAFPSDVFAAVEHEAHVQGLPVSAVLTDTARHRVTIRRGLRAVDAWEGEHGSFTADAIAAVDRELDAAFKRAR